MWYLGSPSQIAPTRNGEAFASHCRYELVRRRHLSTLQSVESQQATAHLIRVLPHIDGWDADLSGHQLPSPSYLSERCLSKVVGFQPLR